MAKDLAANAGVAASHISEIENGKRTLTASLLVKIAHALGETPDSLTEKLEQLSPAVSSALREDKTPYRFTPKFNPSNRTFGDDFESLSRELLRRIPRDHAFELVREFTERAAKGEPDAFGKARALLALLEEAPVIDEKS